MGLKIASIRNGIPIPIVHNLKGWPPRIGKTQPIKNGINNQIICWRKRIKTSVLNEWLKKTVNKIPPPLHNGKQVKLKYLTQVDIGPPKFNIFTNFPKSLKEQYKRYLINTLKKNFQLNGLPIKIVFKKADNPYD